MAGYACGQRGANQSTGRHRVNVFSEKHRVTPRHSWIAFLLAALPDAAAK
jgi:hypothetical protein